MRLRLEPQEPPGHVGSATRHYVVAAVAAAGEVEVWKCQGRGFDLRKTDQTQYQSQVMFWKGLGSASDDNDIHWHSHTGTCVD